MLVHFSDLILLLSCESYAQQFFDLFLEEAFCFVLSFKFDWVININEVHVEAYWKRKGS